MLFRSEMQIGEPTFDGKQYVFGTEADVKAYKTAVWLMVAGGWNRMLNDYTNAAVAAGIVPAGAAMARYTPGNPAFENVQAEGSLLNGALYFVVGQRAYRVPTAVEEQDRQMQAELRKLQALK